MSTHRSNCCSLSTAAGAHGLTPAEILTSHPNQHIQAHKTNSIWTLGTALAFLIAFSGAAQAQWTTLNNPFGSTVHLDTCVLLTNGDVMCHEYASPNWHRRRPDNTGSYLNGTWDSPPITPMPNGTDTSSVTSGMTTITCTPCVYAPTYFASQVLADGKVVVIGGEYNAQDGNAQVETNIGFLYDPATDSWSTQLTEPFGTGNVGDAPSVVLENKTMLLANVNSTNLASFNESTLTFTALNPIGKIDNNGEEGFTNLPNNRVLAVDANVPSSYEIFDPVSNSWGNSGSTPVTLTDLGGPIAGGPCNSHEVGPGVQRADGTIIYFSGSTLGQNAVYDIATNTWSHPANVDFPKIPSSGPQYGAADSPASLLPDGHVLIMSSPVTCNPISGKPGKFSIFNTPSHFFEWDGTTLTQVSDSANATKFVSYQGRMLLLPTAEVLLTAFDQGSNDAVQLYRNGNPQITGVGPLISVFPPAVLGLGNTYSIAGFHFNGFSQGAFYGDDAQSNTNYPLVRITDSAAHVFYAKTHDHSRMGVQAVSDNTTLVSTNFDIPTGLATGAASLVVVTNGFPSAPYSFTVAPASTLEFTAGNSTTSDFSDSTQVQALLTATSGGATISGKLVTFVLGSGVGTETCSAITVSGLATCNITPNQAAGTYTLTASFAGDSTFAGSSVSTPFIITKEETAVAFTVSSATNSDYDDGAQVQAQLTTDGNPLPNKTVTIKLGAGTGTESCTVTTDALGNATCMLTPNQAAGAYTLTASFAGDSFYVPATTSTSFTINLEETTTTFAGGSATIIAVGHSATLSATLLEDGITPILGRTITITLGTGVTAQSCSGATNASGTATCVIATVSQPLGPNTVTAKFAGDAFYLPSSASEAVILFAFLSQGSMVVGNLDAAAGTTVDFWDSQWTKDNSLTGGPAPDAFKGFADTAPQSCGGAWVATPANSPGPPATVPSYMGVIASSSIGQSGNTVSGDVPIIIVVKTNPGYGPSPGRAGTGTVVATYCH